MRASAMTIGAAQPPAASRLLFQTNLPGACSSFAGLLFSVRFPSGCAEVPMPVPATLGPSSSAPELSKYLKTAKTVAKTATRVKKYRIDSPPLAGTRGTGPPPRCVGRPRGRTHHGRLPGWLLEEEHDFLVQEFPDAVEQRIAHLVVAAADLGVDL